MTDDDLMKEVNDLLYKTDGQPGHDIPWPKVQTFGHAIAAWGRKMYERGVQQGEDNALMALRPWVFSQPTEKELEWARRRLKELGLWKPPTGEARDE